MIDTREEVSGWCHPMTTTAIKAAGLGKRYRIGVSRASNKTLRESIVDAATFPVRHLRALSSSTRRATRLDSSHIWALRDLAFEIPHGQVVGVIGRNGAGKSTLLKILARITQPTAGMVDIYGRIGALLEVGTGFHSELTGRENIYLNGAILGMTRKEIQRKFDEIVAFSEIEEFIDTPVKHYSSGMSLRLGFAVAAHLEPEILIIDEVLAVGDAAFQQKCIGKMSDVSEQGRTVLFVSHNMAAVRGLCSRALWIDKGALVQDGAVDDVVDTYMRQTLATLGDGQTKLSDRVDRKGAGPVRFTTFATRLVGGQKEDPLRVGEDAQIILGYESENEQSIGEMIVFVHLIDSFGNGITMLSNHLEGTRFSRLPPKGEITCTIPRLPLLPGEYIVNLTCRMGQTLSDKVSEAAMMRVVEGDYFGTGRQLASKQAVILLDHKWTS